MDKASANRLNLQIQAAIRPILVENGMELQSCDARFDDSSFDLSVKAKDPNAAIPRWNLEAVGLATDTPPGVKFDYNGTTWTFTGVNLRAKRYPICATRVGDGKPFKLDVSATTSIRRAWSGTLEEAPL